MKYLILVCLIVACLSRSYPLYKQCDSRWGNERLGTSSKTICQAGCLMSSAAMALTGCGHTYTPSTLNTWLTHNGGYVGGDGYVWAAIDKLGLTYKGKIPNSEIKHHLDSGFVVILNVHNGGHWVLAHGYSGDNILVNDPGYSTTEYSLSQIVAGQTSIYSVNKVPMFWHTLVNSIHQSIDYLFADDESVLEEQQVTFVQPSQDITVA